MKTIVVGGQRRAVGKTAVVEGILRAFPPHSWAAVKVTTHAHAESGSRRWGIFEEDDRSGSTDTARYLAAGAARALLAQIPPDRFDDGMRSMCAALGSATGVIIESNSAVRFIHPDAFVFVARSDFGEWKPGALETMKRADAVIVLSTGAEESAGLRTPATRVTGQLVFEAKLPEFAPRAFLDWIAARIAG
jgi:hypothetical protein